MKEKLTKIYGKKPRKLANGDTKEKISAVKLLFKKHYSLPEECIQIAIKLAAEPQPLNVRTEIAKNLMKYQNIPYGMYTDVFQILVESDNSDILNIIKNSSEFKWHEKIKLDFEALNLRMRKLSIPSTAHTIWNLQMKKLTKSSDWNIFQKIHLGTMLGVLSSSKDDRNYCNLRSGFNRILFRQTYKS